jgi:anti-anti-sigma factor
MHSRTPLLPQPNRYARTELAAGFTVVHLRGDIDLLAVEEVTLHLYAATEPLFPRVVVDLRGADFIDASALRLLAYAHRRTVERHGHLGLVCALPWHRRILYAAGLSLALRPRPTLAEACAAALGPARSGTDRPG